METRNSTWFVASAIGNGLAAGGTLAALARGHWVLALTSSAASIVFAAGMIKTMGALRCGRLS